jgi:hypothetical protein
MLERVLAADFGQPPDYAPDQRIVGRRSNQQLFQGTLNLLFYLRKGPRFLLRKVIEGRVNEQLDRHFAIWRSKTTVSTFGPPVRRWPAPPFQSSL